MVCRSRMIRIYAYKQTYIVNVTLVMYHILNLYYVYIYIRVSDKIAHNDSYYVVGKVKEKEALLVMVNLSLELNDNIRQATNA